MTMLQSHRVQIGGEEVQIRSDQPPQVVGEVAGYLNGRIQEVGKGAAKTDRFRVLALAALSVAGEVLELQSKLKENDQAKHRIRMQAKSLSETLDRALMRAG